MSENNPQLINPFLGNNRRETMHKVSAVLNFVSRSAEMRANTNLLQGSVHSLDDFNDDELSGLTLIYQALIQALEYEPTPKMNLG